MTTHLDGSPSKDVVRRRPAHGRGGADRGLLVVAPPAGVGLALPVAGLVVLGRREVNPPPVR